MIVEGKIGEYFGPTLDEWRSKASPGKQERLSYLLRILGLGTTPPGTVRYQLSHRAVSALTTAGQYRAIAAILLVHSIEKGSSQSPLTKPVIVYSIS